LARSLEQFGAEPSLDGAEAAKRGGMVHFQRPRGTGQRSGGADGANQPQVVRREGVRHFSNSGA